MTRKRSPELCVGWPDCSCARRKRWFLEVEPNVGPLNKQELRDVWEATVLMLECTSRHCPNRRVRQHAQWQLMLPIFAKLPKELEDA